MDFLAWLIAFVAPAAVTMDVENARAAACVSVAYAVVGTPAAPPPPPAPPKPGECCGACNGTGSITHGDGHRTPCPCPPTCRCKTKKAEACPDGTCVVR